MTTSTETDLRSGDAPPIPPSFDALPLSSPVRRAIDDIGWLEPTPVQLRVYPEAVEGRDLIVQSRTGTGKTGAFALPILDRLVRPEPKVQALVLAPTRELALQSQREIERLAVHTSIRSAAIYGGAPMDRQVKLLRQGVQVLSGTPGRVLDHLRRGTLDPDDLRVLVLDEADEILSMGFAKELNAIFELLPRQRQTLLFSATVGAEIERMAERHMREPVFLGLSGDAVGAQGISHFVYMVSGRARARDLIRILEIEDPESAVIFCNTKADTERVATELKHAGFNADWLNGDLPQSDREKVMRRTRGGDLRYLVATDVAARGIDISHLTHVINYQLPEAAEQYIHRTGRTGRAGRTGVAISLISPQELGALYYLRLQYQITPIERSLPTAGEERTRREADRLALLEEAFPGQVREPDRALAQRLLTHPDAERLLAGLLRTFFGASEEEVAEQAAAARCARLPVETEPRRERPRRGEQRRPPSRRESEPSPRRTPEPPPARLASPPPRESEPAEESDHDELSNGNAPGLSTVYINIGRNDGVRAGEMSRLLREMAGLTRRDIGKIRVRDKHTFVGIPTERVDAVLASLNGQSFADRAVVAELAKATKA